MTWKSRLMACVPCKNALICQCYLLGKAHSKEQTPLTRVFASGTHITAKSTEATRIKCLTQGHSILMQREFEPSMAVSRNRQLTHMTHMTYMLRVAAR